MGGQAIARLLESYHSPSPDISESEMIMTATKHRRMVPTSCYRFECCRALGSSFKPSLRVIDTDSRLKELCQLINAKSTVVSKSQDRRDEVQDAVRARRRASISMSMRSGCHPNSPDARSDSTARLESCLYIHSLRMRP